MKPRKLLGLLLAFPLLAAVLTTPCMAMPKAERTVLENGLTVLVFEDHSIPAVTLQLLVSAGSWLDPKDLEGLANLTLKSMVLGTAALSFEQVNQRLDFIGANLDSECRKDFAALGMQVLKKELDTGFGLFLEVLTTPSFPDADVKREKDNITGKLRADEDQPMIVANRAFEKALFVNSPYARQVEGTEQSLARIDVAAIKKFYESFYRPNNSILVIGGDITPEEVKSSLNPRLVAWQKAEVPRTEFGIEFAPGPETVSIDKPVSQASIVIGCPGIERGHKDYYIFSVLNQILGSGDLNSRLMNEVRVKAGLAYSIESVILSRKHTGSFRVLMQTKNASAKQAIDIVMAELKRLREEPVSEAELELAKKFLVGNFPLRFSGTQTEYARFLSQVEFYGLGSDYPDRYPSLINAVTSHDILRIAKERLVPSGPVTAIVADLEKANMK